MNTTTVTHNDTHGNPMDVLVILPDEGDNEWNTYRLAADQFLAASENILYNEGRVVVRTRWAEVTFDSNNGNVVLLTGEVGPRRPTMIAVTWTTGPDGPALHTADVPSHATTY